MIRKISQHGSVHSVAIIGLVLALIVALGWIFYQNFIYEEPQATTDDTSLVETGGESDVDAVEEAKYVDLRKDIDGSGAVVASAEDVSKLEGASQKLKDYFSANAGESEFTVDRTYGDFAVGQSTSKSAYLVWGPDADGAIAELAATQANGFACDTLKAGSVPTELVDGKCSDGDGGMVDYKM